MEDGGFNKRETAHNSVDGEKWWKDCSEHGEDIMPSGSCHDCAMLAPDFSLEVE